MNNLSIAAIASIFLIGCGSSGGSNGGSELIGSEDSGKIDINKIYAMHPGDKVLKDSDDAIIEVTHSNNHPDSTIKLLSGEATIIRFN